MYTSKHKSNKRSAEYLAISASAISQALFQLISKSTLFLRAALHRVVAALWTYCEPQIDNHIHLSSGQLRSCHDWISYPLNIWTATFNNIYVWQYKSVAWVTHEVTQCSMEAYLPHTYRISRPNFSHGPLNSAIWLPKHSWHCGTSDIKNIKES